MEGPYYWGRGDVLRAGVTRGMLRAAILGRQVRPLRIAGYKRAKFVRAEVERVFRLNEGRAEG